MSLNGLDDAKLAAAHEAAAAEPGGWFLLKYATRDAVEVMGRGTGGISELRNAVAEYDETSPLFGFLKYRRRNVIIKYLPDGCSRLIQARVAVHFNAVCERLGPYDITFDITEADELRDTRLSAACSLHAASNSNTSSTSSLRKKRLGEIAEEDEDEQRSAKRQSLTKEEDVDVGEQPPAAPADPVTLNADLAASPEHSKFAAASTSELPNFVGVDAHHQRPSTSSAATIAEEAPSNRRLSSQTLRPDLFTSSSYTYGKPKVKLGPRPSLDVGARPQTAGNFRPVSTIPAGLKLFGKGSKKGKNKDDAASIMSATSPREAPEMGFPPITRGDSGGDGARPNTSSGVSTASTITSAPMPVPAKHTISREKARLMKAKQLREKKKKMSMQLPEESLMPTTDAPVDVVATDATPATDDAPPTETEAILKNADEGSEAKVEDASEPTHEQQEREEKHISMIKADSGVVIEELSSPVHTDEASELTHTDSRPQSPAVASPEPGQSTKASSLSESTDETVQAKDYEVPEKTETGDESGKFAVEVENADEVAASTSEEVVEEAVQPSSEEEKAEVETAAVEKDTAEDNTAEGDTQQSAPESQTIEEHTIVSDEKVVQDVTKEPSEAQETPGANVATVEASTPILQGEHKEKDVEGEVVEGQAAAVPVKEDSDDAEVEAKLEEKSATADTAPEQDDAPGAAVVATEAQVSDSPENDADTAAEETEEMVKAPASNTEVDIPTSHAPESTQPETHKIPQPAPATEEEPAPIPLKIPKSKFSTQDLRAASKAAAAIPSEPVPVAAPADAPSYDTSAAPAPAKSKRKPVEPIRTDLTLHSRNTSRSDFSVDDDLMDELQSATVQEAKPMLVAKTPLSPGFPSDVMGGAPPQPATPASAKPHMVRTVSNPLRGPLITPTDVSQSSARSLSMGAAYLHKVTQREAAGNLSKKNNVGSGISQRIKALEMLSAEPAGATVQKSNSVRSDRPSSTFFSVKKSREASRSPSVVDRAGSFTKQTPSAAVESRDSSPETDNHPRRDRSGSMASRLSMFESPPGAPGHSPGNKPRGRPESISVTARIIRDPGQGTNSPRNPSEHGHLALKQSPLFVDHQKASPEPAAERRSSRESHRSGSHDLAKDGKSRRSSMSIVKDFIKERRRSITSSSGDALAAHSHGTTPSRSPSRPPSTHQNSTPFSHRLSMSSRRSLSRDRDAVRSPTALTESSISGDEAKSSADKKKSRAGRFMRRLSSLSGSRGKTSTLPGISPTVAEEDNSFLAAESHQHAALARPSTTGTPAIVSYLGDVNVQFPDTLLWKRRNMCLDASGFLILSALPAQNGRPAQTGTKRYHLSEFRPPYTPDVEVQELPNSVVLDLKEGSGVQVACEDRPGQMAVLQVLHEAHAAHAAGFGV